MWVSHMINESVMWVSHMINESVRSCRRKYSSLVPMAQPPISAWNEVWGRDAADPQHGRSKVTNRNNGLSFNGSIRPWLFHDHGK